MIFNVTYDLDGMEYICQMEADDREHLDSLLSDTDLKYDSVSQDETRTEVRSFEILERIASGDLAEVLHGRLCIAAFHALIFEVFMLRKLGKIDENCFSDHSWVHRLCHLLTDIQFDRNDSIENFILEYKDFIKGSGLE